MSGETFPKSWIAGAGDSLEAIDKVQILAVRDREWLPRQLSWRDVNSGVDRDESRLSVFVIGKIGLQEKN